MTVDDVLSKSDIRRIPELYKQLQHDREHLRYLREKATSVGSTTQNSEKVQTSPSNDSMRYIDAAVDLEREIREKELELLDLQSAAAEFRKNLTDPLQRQVIRYRYLKCCTWEQVADLLGYSVRRVYQVEAEALKKL